MLPRKNRVDKKTVEKIFKLGKFVNYPNLTFKFILTADSAPPRISFIVPKSVAKLAVQRNFLRRRGYAALFEYITKFPHGLVGVFIFKKQQDDILVLQDEIKNILNKVN